MRGLAIGRCRRLSPKRRRLVIPGARILLDAAARHFACFRPTWTGRGVVGCEWVGRYALFRN